MGLETSASRGPYRIHERIDWSCSLEQEDLRFGCSGFISGLLDDMACRPLPYLQLHYPELVFGTSVKKPTGHEFVQNAGRNLWRWADWRTA